MVSARISHIVVVELSLTADKLFPVLVHCGVVLKGSDTLNDAGITSGSMIHCFPKSGKFGNQWGSKKERDSI